MLTKDQMLYPNPTADQIHGDSSPHYYFIGHTQNIGRIIKHWIPFSINWNRRFTRRFAGGGLSLYSGLLLVESS